MTSYPKLALHHCFFVKRYSTSTHFSLPPPQISAALAAKKREIEERLKREQEQLLQQVGLLQ